MNRDLEGGWRLHDQFLEHVSSEHVHSGGYEISYRRLLELGDNDGYSWPQHMGSKTWCDGRVFFRAWLAACADAGLQIDPDRLLKTFQTAFDRKTSPLQDARDADSAQRIAAGETPRVVNVSDLNLSDIGPRPGWLE